MTDFADLALRVDSTSVKTLIAELDKIPAAGARAEAATGLLTGATAQAKVETERLKTALAAARASPAVQFGPRFRSAGVSKSPHTLRDKSLLEMADE